jgi:hypothetical protein
MIFMFILALNEIIITGEPENAQTIYPFVAR